LSVCSLLSAPSFFLDHHHHPFLTQSIPDAKQTHYNCSYDNLQTDVPVKHTQLPHEASCVSSDRFREHLQYSRIGMFRNYFFLVLLSCRWLAIKSFSIDDSSIGFDRAVAKAAGKFYEFGKRRNATLVVDGNNVRGIGKFEWNPVELQARISSFCQEFGISRAVVIWDHGRCKFATYESRSSDIVDMVVVFSGLTQRADDVMVKELRHLALVFCNDDWSSLCFVTNDRALQQRLTQRITSITSSGSDPGKRSLLMDSTRFFDLLSKQDKDYKCDTNDRASYLIRQAQKSLQDFATMQSLRYNAHREKTWERCVLAEALRRFYSERALEKSHVNLFSHRYILDLQKRGYANPSTIDDESSDTTCTVPGPPRLDRRQRRLLNRYNKARKVGKI
jgi:hypothetical protein